MSNYYEERRQRKAERARELARKNERVAEEYAIDKVAGEENTGIPAGQPILVGHHSEKAHRNHLKRIDNQIRKGIEAGKKAEYYEEKAERLESGNGKIDSDDPEAINKLSNKIEWLENKREEIKSFNKLARKKGRNEALKDYPHFAEYFQFELEGKVSLPSYVLTNLGRVIRDTKKRRNHLKSLQGVDYNASFENGISTDLEEGRIRVHFPGKPDKEVRDVIKRYPFSLKWSRYQSAWVRKVSPNTNAAWFEELKNYLKGL